MKILMLSLLMVSSVSLFAAEAEKPAPAIESPIQQDSVVLPVVNNEEVKKAVDPDASLEVKELTN